MKTKKFFRVLANILMLCGFLTIYLTAVYSDNNNCPITHISSFALSGLVMFFVGLAIHKVMERHYEN